MWRVPVTQWVKPLLIGHSACWPDGSRPPGFKYRVWKVVFQLDWPSGHAMRLNSRTGTEGLRASLLNCDRALCSGIRATETVMSSTDGQITDSIRPYAVCWSLKHQSLL